jgi:hypothetical protein
MGGICGAGNTGLSRALRLKVRVSTSFGGWGEAPAEPLSSQIPAAHLEVRPTTKRLLDWLQTSPLTLISDHAPFPGNDFILRFGGRATMITPTE